MPEATSAAARSCPRYPRTRRSPQPPLSRTSVSRWIGSVTNPVAAPQAPRRNDSAVELRHSPTLCAPQPLDGKRALLTRRSRSSDGFCTRVSPYRPSRTGRRWRCTRWTEDLGFPKASPAPVSCPGWRGTRGSRDASCGKHKVESGRLDLASTSLHCRSCGHAGRCLEVDARRGMRPRGPRPPRGPFEHSHYDRTGSRVRARTRLRVSAP